MLSPEFQQLKNEYARELRDSKAAAELWWKELNQSYSDGQMQTNPVELWPLGPVSHPWVIATYRKYYFLCLELNNKTRESTGAPFVVEKEEDWGNADEDISIAYEVEPKVFVLDSLSGGETNDLYEFLLSLVFVPIGLKADEFA